VAVTGLVDYGPGYAENPPVTAADFDEIAALGFDFVRLPVSWSRIEPRPGVYDRAYLGLVDQTVRSAQERGLLTLVDLHLDRYSSQLVRADEADGAPGWATLTPATPCPAKLASADCIRAAWESFWQDRKVGGVDLQQHYIAALVALSRQLRAEPGLAGIELMNNPSTGDLSSPAFERSELWPFWRRAITALRAAGERRPLWIDRAASTETADAEQSGLPARLSGDRGLVYAPHDYTAVFSTPAWPAGGTARLAQWYATARHDAAALGTAFAVGEWGGQAGGAWEQLLSSKLDLQDSGAVSSAFWMWKQRPGFYNWPVVQVDGTLRSDTGRAQALSRPHADAVPGSLVGERFDGARLTVELGGAGGAGGTGGAGGAGGAGGTATLWSGTQVLAGGPSPLPAPLTHVTIDGRPATATLSPKRYADGGVSLLGYLVDVHVPPGRHTIELG
jgi:hypothetical protein